MSDGEQSPGLDRGTSVRDRGTTTSPHRQSSAGPRSIATSEYIVAHREVAVGELIALSVTPLPDILASITGSVLSTEWNVPGQAVKGYQQTLEIGRVFPLTAKDLRSSTLSFYWIDGGDGRKVTAECVFKTLLGVNATVVCVWIFDVKAPKLRYLKDRRPIERRGRTRIGQNRGALALEFTAGIDHQRQRLIRRRSVVARQSGTQWEWSIAAPKNHGGEVKDIQTLYGTRRLTRYVDRTSDNTEISTFRVKRSGVLLPLVSIPGAGPHEGYLVHDGVPEGEPRYGSEYPRRVLAGSEDGDMGSGADSPDSVFDPKVTARLFVHEVFQYFIMFRSNKPGSIWVTIGMAKWYWKGEVISNRKSYRLVGQEGGVISQGVATAELPVYEGHSAFLDWE